MPLKPTQKITVIVSNIVLFCLQCFKDGFVLIYIILDPDPLEHATGREKKMLIARLAGDDVSYLHSLIILSLALRTQSLLPR